MKRNFSHRAGFNPATRRHTDGMARARFQPHAAAAGLNPVAPAVIIEIASRCLHPNELADASYCQPAARNTDSSLEVSLEKACPFCLRSFVLFLREPRLGPAGRCHVRVWHDCGSFVEQLHVQFQHELRGARKGRPVVIQKRLSAPQQNPEPDRAAA